MKTKNSWRSKFKVFPVLLCLFQVVGGAPNYGLAQEIVLPEPLPHFVAKPIEPLPRAIIEAYSPDPDAAEQRRLEQQLLIDRWQVGTTQTATINEYTVIEQDGLAEPGDYVVELAVYDEEEGRDVSDKFCNAAAGIFHQVAELKVRTTRAEGLSGFAQTVTDCTIVLINQ